LNVDAGPAAPPGGLWLAWPGDDALPQANVNGRAAVWEGRMLRIPALPAQVRLGAP
jgi:hypothetical protein